MIQADERVITIYNESETVRIEAWGQGLRVRSTILPGLPDNDWALDVPVDLCLAFHTDGQDSGNDSTIIGTLVIYSAKDDEGKTTLRNGKDRELTNRNLADWIQTQIVSDLRTIAPEWTRRQLKEANYCETRVPVVPSLILELLSHKNMADMKSLTSWLEMFCRLRLHDSRLIFARFFILQILRPMQRPLIIWYIRKRMKANGIFSKWRKQLNCRWILSRAYGITST